MELFDFDTLVAPARTMPGKSIGLDRLLAEDPGLLRRHQVRWWIGSSASFDEATRGAALSQGVDTVSNLYGSSEFGPFAISCAASPADLHLAEGHVLIEVVDEGGTPVASGRSGRVVATHLAGLDEHGESTVHTGTQILRLANADAATWIDEPCACGVGTPRLRDVHRVAP